MTKTKTINQGELRLVMCGCHEYGAQLIPRLISAGLRFEQFVVLSPDQGAHNGISGYCDLRPLAEKAGIPVYVPERYDLKGERDIAFFHDKRFDVLIQGGWQRLFPNHVLASLRVGAIGVHGSPDFLPKGRGRSPLNWSLIQGERRFLLQLFLMQAGVDDGDVFDWDDFDITPFDTIRSLYQKNVIATARMVVRSLPALAAGTCRMRPQSGTPSHYEKRGPEDGRIDWEEMNVWQIHNMVRALTRPFPGAFAELDGETHTIWNACVFDTRLTYPDAAYGEIVERFDGEAIVNCRGGLLKVMECEKRSQGRNKVS